MCTTLIDRSKFHKQIRATQTSYSLKDHARAWEDLNVAPVPLWVCCKVEAEQRCCHAATFLVAVLATATRSLQQPSRQHAHNSMSVVAAPLRMRPPSRSCARVCARCCRMLATAVVLLCLRRQVRCHRTTVRRRHETPPPPLPPRQRGASSHYGTSSLLLRSVLDINEG